MAQAREITFIKRLGKHLKMLRLKEGLTQQQLAFESGLELSQISRIERGLINTSVSQLFIIAKTLEVEPKMLFDFELTDHKQKINKQVSALCRVSICALGFIFIAIGRWAINCQIVNIGI